MPKIKCISPPKNFGFQCDWDTYHYTTEDWAFCPLLVKDNRINGQFFVSAGSIRPFHVSPIFGNTFRDFVRII